MLCRWCGLCSLWDRTVWKCSKLLLLIEASDLDGSPVFLCFFLNPFFLSLFILLIFSFTYITRSFVHITSKCACIYSFSFALHAFFTGLLRTRGSVLDKPSSTWEDLSKKGDLTSRTPEEQPYRKEEWKTPGVVMQKTSKPGAVVVY